MDERISLDYGSGGKKTSQLIDEIILPLLGGPELSELGDAAVLDGAEKLVFSTDSFVVSPYFFPGGDIGKLSVCGTVNDVSMQGGDARYLSLSFIIEEGLPMADLRRIAASIAETAKKAGVRIVTGDTKVVERGKGDGIYLNTAGIGTLHHPGLSINNIRPGDKVILSGTAGDHGAAVMLARNSDMLKGELLSDCALLKEPAMALSELGDGLKVMRDPTRGGIANALCEFAEGRPFSIRLDEGSIPVDPAVASACDILGLDPLYCANEGKLIAVVSADKAELAVDILKRFEVSEGAAVIGEVRDEYPGKVLVRTALGSSRIVAKLTGAQLPRIC